jgi:hypothetical protein
MGKGLLIANVLGGVVAIAAYEVLVMAPFYPLMVALIVMLAMVGARALVSGGKLAPLAGPSLNGFIVLLGGTLAPLGDDAQTALTDRLISIGGAVLYVAIAHAIVSGVKTERDNAEPPAPAEGPEAPPVEA